MILISYVVLISVIYSKCHAADNVTSILSKDEPVFFTREPEGRTIGEGEELRLYCKLDHEPAGLKYSWYKYNETSAEDFKDILLQVYGQNYDRINLVEGYTGDELVFSSIAREDIGYYQCIIQTGSYTVFSGIAHIKVNYFDEPAALVSVESRNVKAFEDEVYLPCAVFDSSPVVDVYWTQNGSRISNERMFVYPEEYYYIEKITRGTLLILNVQQGRDSGIYECHTEKTKEFPKEKVLTSYQIKTVKEGFDAYTQKWVVPAFSSYNEIGGNVVVESGDTVTLACAARGYPIPTYTWKIGNSQSDKIIRNSEFFELKDHDRRLVINNIGAALDLVCIMRNTFNGKDRENQRPFYIILKNKTKSSAIEFINDRTNQSSVTILKPNQYKPFTMGCHVSEDDYQILWLKNGNKADWISRERVEETRNSTSVTFTFKSPNESDLGVYQCVVVSSDGETVNVKQQTTYITLQKDLPTVDFRSKQPNYLFLHGPFHVDKAEEACKDIGMHLVSILDLEENEAVVQIVRNNNVSNVWIGLTREVPEPMGTWRWTLPGDASFTFSNWDHGKPDNQIGYQEYAVMKNETGKWEDVRRDSWKRPALCKNYTVACTSVDTFYQGRVRVGGWEPAGATYYVGEKVQVFCRYPNKNKNSTSSQVITCGQDTNFDQLHMDDCTDRDSFFLSINSSSDTATHIYVIIILSLCFCTQFLQ
ncbi:neural cell adhesion molecule 1-like [Bolinopsis microptera]|uniref:neural cell adhesion molecule 1-like n=1 Tax=Bolinopsis microptera TaxID=2820187 RepID=UPI003079DFBF